MGTHYDGLILDDYISNSVLDIDYLSINDYFEKVAEVSYCETETLFTQYSILSIEKKLNVISAILTLINFSSYGGKDKSTIIRKSKSFLERFGLEIVEQDNEIVIKNELKLFEGSYCDIFLFNNQFYKKQLKDKYRINEDWRKRFKYEFENMEKLSESPYVLKVFSYDSNSDSYLMEKCDCNIADYLEKKPFITDEEVISLITQIITGMIDVHEAGIIHRDLHLGNILLINNNIILSDFGLSKDTMMYHSLKSTSTPKNSHFFMDPIGLSDFTKLDKYSDIFSIGKIIDYITRNNSLNTKLSYVINKATARDRFKRYGKLSDLLDDFNSSLRDVSAEERLIAVEHKIARSENSPEVESFILELVSNDQIATYIVKKKLNNFNVLLLTFNETIQATLLDNILDNYAEATGYGRFENYDLFAGIMYRFIHKSTSSKLQRIAYEVLEGCAQYRYNANDYLKETDISFPNLKKSK